jgi:hypothetical protein
VNVGKFIEHLDHAVIIFEPVHADPRQAVFTGYQIFIERLVLMPQNYDANDRHGWKI